MTPNEVVHIWVELFNHHDAVEISLLYPTDSINHQVTEAPILGKRQSKKCSKTNSIKLAWTLS